MIDIIIPVYNAHDTLLKTLMSIDLQTIKEKVKVYIIDDASTNDYDDILKECELNIFYHRLNENVGAGLARQKGIDISNSEYIVFLDSDDLFYDADALKRLYENIKLGYDQVAGITYNEKSNIYNVNEGDLHGKIYSREYLLKHNIRFNETRFHEDNYFNNLFLSCDPKYKQLDECIYIYSNNLKSLTNLDSKKEFERIKILISNVRCFIDETKKRDSNKDVIAFLLLLKIRYFNRIYPNFTDDEKTTFKNWLEEYQLDFSKYIGQYDDNKIIEELKKDI